MRAFYRLLFVLFSTGLLVPAYAQSPVYLGKIRAVAELYKKGASEARTKKTGLEAQVNHRLPGNKSLELKVNASKQEGPATLFFGEVENSKLSNFYLKITEREVTGSIIIREQKKFFRYSSTADGSVYLTEENIDKVICVGLNEEKDAKNKTGKTTSSSGSNSDASVAAVPVLESFPGAEAVLYLDFDGQTVTNTLWNNNFNSGNPIVASPADLSEAEMVRVWKMMSEDYRPFSLNVTTSEAVFNSVPASKRMRIIFTPTSYFYPNAGGVAYVGSFTWGGSYGETPCWVFNATSKYAAEAGSHEGGHTLFLNHDGRTTPSEEYYEGQGSWSPIMGVGYYRPVVQWSKGEYANPSNTEDDLLTISTLNGFGYRPDDHANSMGEATPLVKEANGLVLAAANKGVISTPTDIDVFSFTHTGGQLSLSVNPDPADPNLDILLTLRDANGIVVTTADPASMGASLDENLTAGTYYLTIDGTTGVLGANSDYGSLGDYSISTKDYCVPTYAVGCTRFATLINKFSFHTLANNNSGCANGTAEGYTHYAPTGTLTTSVIRGQSYPINIEAGAAYSQHMGVWVDYNNDKDFEDAGEFVYASPTAGSQFAATITVPATAALGATRMRVRSNYDPAISSGQACSVMNYGEAEDYTITITGDQAPTVALTSPANGAGFVAPASISIAADAADADGTVVKVEFFAGATKLGEDLTAPYDYTWSGVAAGTYSLTATATDNTGATTTSAAVAVTVTDNGAPSVRITAPADGATYTAPATITLTADAADADGSVAKVEFFSGATKLGEDLTAPYSYRWSGVTAGTYSLTVKATDNLGAATTSAAVAVTVSGPTVAQGCGVGYWKNHPAQWSCYATGTRYGTVFQDAPATFRNKTLLEVLGLGGGGANNLGRQSVAALLNICSSGIAYSATYPTIASLQTAVNQAFRSTNKNAAGNLATSLDNFNNAGCPLGRPATVAGSSTAGSAAVSSASSSAKPLDVYPNPSLGDATIEFTLAKAQQYSVQVFDVKGRVVAPIASGLAEAGKRYSFQVVSRELPAGVYMVRLLTEEATQMSRLIINK